MSTTLMPCSGPIRILPMARAQEKRRLRDFGPAKGSSGAYARAAGVWPHAQRWLLFLLAGFADLHEAVELVVLLVNAVGDARLVLLAGGGSSLLDQLADVVLEDRDAIIELVHREIVVVVAHAVVLAIRSVKVGQAKRAHHDLAQSKMVGTAQVRLATLRQLTSTARAPKRNWRPPRRPC